MIYEGSCDTEDWSNDYIFKYIKIENSYFIWEEYCTILLFNWIVDGLL